MSVEVRAAKSNVVVYTPVVKAGARTSGENAGRGGKEQEGGRFTPGQQVHGGSGGSQARLDAGELREALINALTAKYGVAPRECVDLLVERYSTGYSSVKEAVQTALKEVDSRLRERLKQVIDEAYNRLMSTPEGRILLTIATVAALKAGGFKDVAVPSQKDFEYAYNAYKLALKYIIREQRYWRLDKWLDMSLYDWIFAGIRVEGGMLKASIGNQSVTIEPWLAAGLAARLLSKGRVLVVSRPSSGFRIEISDNSNSVTIRYLVDVNHPDKVDRRTLLLLSVFCARGRDNRVEVRRDGRYWIASIMGYTMSFGVPAKFLSERRPISLSCGCGVSQDYVFEYAPIVAFSDVDFPPYTHGFRVMPAGYNVGCLKRCIAERFGGWLPATAIVVCPSPRPSSDPVTLAYRGGGARKLLESEPGVVCGGSVAGGLSAQ